MTNTKIVENPHTKNKFLRFCVGTVEKRNMMLPIYLNNPHIVSRHDESASEVDIFMVRGFGETLEKAERMARRAK